MNLLELETQEEFDHFDGNITQNHGDFFNYPANDYYNRYIFIGAMKDSTNKWYWVSSGETINYDMRWLPNEPNNAKGPENCLSIAFKNNLQNTGFNDGTCVQSEKSWRFICEELTHYPRA